MEHPLALKMLVNVKECNATCFSAYILLFPAVFDVLIPNVMFVLAGMT